MTLGSFLILVTLDQWTSSPWPSGTFQKLPLFVDFRIFCLFCVLCFAVRLCGLFAPAVEYMASACGPPGFGALFGWPPEILYLGIPTTKCTISGIWCIRLALDTRKSIRDFGCPFSAFLAPAFEPCPRRLGTKCLLLALSLLFFFSAFLLRDVRFHRHR